MNNLSREERVALLEEARTLQEETGWGVEKCMVELQHARQQKEFWEQQVRLVNQVLEQVASVVDSWVSDHHDAMMGLIEHFQALSDQIGADLRLPHCPAHRIAMRGGRCSKCDQSPRDRRTWVVNHLQTDPQMPLYFRRAKR